MRTQFTLHDNKKLLFQDCAKRQENKLPLFSVMNSFDQHTKLTFTCNTYNTIYIILSAKGIYVCYTLFWLSSGLPKLVIAKFS